MITFEESYCARHRCTPAQFRRRVFWLTLHRHALLFAPLALLGGHFEIDHELIAACGRARTLRELQEELKDHRNQPENARWLRRWLRLRVSTQRLRRLARQHLSCAAAAHLTDSLVYAPSHARLASSGTNPGG